MAFRLAQTFARLRAEGRPGLVTYTTAGDPDLRRSSSILQALDRAGNNLTRAARLLGIGRGALRYRLDKHGIPIK